MIARRLLLVAAVLATGCATVAPPPAGLPARQDIRDFGLEARFALRLERPNDTPQSAAGRLSWRHGADGDHIMIANPLGQGIAEIAHHAACQKLCAELRTGNGEVRRANDPAILAQEATGYPLPLADLPGWLLGRPGTSGRLEADRAGRPRRLVDAGWQIDYDYDSEAAGALPSRLTLRQLDRPGQPGEIELRLRIEEWRDSE